MSEDRPPPARSSASRVTAASRSCVDDDGPRHRRALQRARVPRVREDARGTHGLGDAAAHEPHLRHLPGQPPPRRGQGGRRRCSASRSRRRRACSASCCSSPASCTTTRCTSSSSPGRTSCSATTPRAATSSACSQARPDLAREAIALRQGGQRIVEAVGGQASHPVTAIPGGMSRPLADEVRDELLARRPRRTAARGGGRACSRARRRCGCSREHPGFAADADAAAGADRADGARSTSTTGTIVALGRRRQDRRARSAPRDYARAHRRARAAVQLREGAVPAPRSAQSDGHYRVGRSRASASRESMRGERADAAAARRSTPSSATRRPALAYHWARMIELVAVLRAAWRSCSPTRRRPRPTCA